MIYQGNKNKIMRYTHHNGFYEGESVPNIDDEEEQPELSFTTGRSVKAGTLWRYLLKLNMQKLNDTPVPF